MAEAERTATSWLGSNVLAGVVVIVAVLVLSQTREQQGSDEGVAEPSLLDTFFGWLFWAVLRCIQLVVSIALLLLAILVARQRSILYVPAPPNMERSTAKNPSIYRSPENWSLPFEEVYISTSDNVRVHAWLIYQPPATSKQAPYTLMYFHGNAGNIGHRLENIRDMHKHLGVNILIIDYRGYGDSEDGAGPCESGFMLDAEAAYKWLLERASQCRAGSATVSADRILIFGRSIGGAVAIKLFAHLLRERMAAGGSEAIPLPCGLILENTFTSLSDMATQVFPFLAFLRPLLRPPLIFDEWNSRDRLDFLSQNHEHWCCCLLSGLKDEIVPPQQMRELHTLLKKRRPKLLKFFAVANGGHNDTPTKGGREYWDSFQKFMELVDGNEWRAAPPEGAAAGGEEKSGE